MDPDLILAGPFMYFLDDVFAKKIPVNRWSTHIVNAYARSRHDRNFGKGISQDC
jgi:hypothetical protein